jgi:ornithine cyclodeaminase/alanine dehydrogenase-like protein (mu-crystallin family)
MGIPLDGGGHHAKDASLPLSRPYVAAKININLPRNPAERGLPTIQGVLALFDGATGTPLAVMDSASITAARTAAASAVAAKYLARTSATAITFVGCGVQARAHLAALRAVRPVTHVFAIDVDGDAASRFVDEVRKHASLEAVVTAEARAATRSGDIIVTSTPSTRPVLVVDDVRPGTFIAAVGADNEEKHEIHPELLRCSAVIVDDLDQCARMGDLHHALTSGAMSLGGVRASLDQIVTGSRAGRVDDTEIIVFDSTGVAIEDVAAAALVYESVSA